MFFSRDYDRETRQLWEERTLPDDPTVYVCAADRSAADVPGQEPDEERFFVIVNAPADADRAPLAPDAVERCEQAMLARLAACGLELTPRAIVRMTPSLYERLAPGTGGAIYGEAAHGATAPLARPASRTQLAGLYVAGGSVHPGPGVPMAALSGRLCAAAVRADSAAVAKRAVALPRWQRQERSEQALGEAAERALATGNHRGEA